MENFFDYLIISISILGYLNAVDCRNEIYENQCELFVCFSYQLFGYYVVEYYSMTYKICHYKTENKDRIINEIN